MTKSKRRNMFLFYFSISLAIAASALYHLIQKQVPPGVSPAVSVIVTYAVSIVLCLVLLGFMWPAHGFVSALRELNWTSYVLALALVGLELGFLLVYRSGWNIGIAAVLVNVVASLILVPVAILVFHERLSFINVAGILVSLAGLVLMNWGR